VFSQMEANAMNGLTTEGNVNQPIRHPTNPWIPPPQIFPPPSRSILPTIRVGGHTAILLMVFQSSCRATGLWMKPPLVTRS
jgi:hypothetical protein